MLNFSGGTSLRGPEYPVVGRDGMGFCGHHWAGATSRAGEGRLGAALPSRSHGGPAAGGRITYIYNLSICFIYLYIKISGGGFWGGPLGRLQEPHITETTAVLALGCRWHLPGARASGLRTLLICKTFSVFLGTSGGPPWGDAATWSSE